MKSKRVLSELWGRAFFLVAYPLYYKHKLEKTNHVKLFGFSLTIPQGVFHPGLFFTTKILGKYLFGLDLKGKAVLEVGCGSGLLSMIVASKGAMVTSVDISSTAIECTHQNAKANGLNQQMQIKQSDLFEGISNESNFDLIVWNPPFFPKEPSEESGRAWNAGEGYLLLKRFADQAIRYVAPGGKLLLLLTDKVDEKQVLDFFLNPGFSIRTVLTKRSFFEIFTIHEMTVKSGQTLSN